MWMFSGHPAENVSAWPMVGERPASARSRFSGLARFLGSGRLFLRSCPCAPVLPGATPPLVLCPISSAQRRDLEGSSSCVSQASALLAGVHQPSQ